MTPEIKSKENFLTRRECAKLLRKIHDRKDIWENRQDRRVPYRNGAWYTVGSNMYLDSHLQPGEYAKKIEYWNWMLLEHFGQELEDFMHAFRNWTGHSATWLRDKIEYASFAGFHIFRDDETLSAPFGKAHQDLQWKHLPLVPGFNEAFPGGVDRHFSLTLMLKTPYLGASMEIIASGESLHYTEGTLYMHSGQFTHMIAPYESPVLPGDERISLQAHGFYYNNTAYLYW